MKPTIRFLSSAIPLLLFAGLLYGQGTPNCQYTLSFTAAGSQSPAFSNLPTTTGGGQGCVAWRVVYWTNTSSATSIQIEGAADAVSGGVHGPTGSYTVLTPAAGGGSGSGATTNPATATVSGQINACCDYWPWIRITVNTLTSSGAGTLLTVQVLGFKGTSAGAGSGGGGGGGTFTALTGDATSTATGGATTVVGLNNTLLSGLATGLLKNTTGTGKPSIAVEGTDYQGPPSVASVTGTSGSVTYPSLAGGVTEINLGPLSGNVTAATCPANQVAGQVYVLHISQNATGGYTNTLPSCFQSSIYIASEASSLTDSLWRSDGANLWLAAPVTNSTGHGIVPEVSAPATTPTVGTGYPYANSTDHDYEYANNGGGTMAMVLKGSDINAALGTVTNGSHITNSSIPNSGLVNPATTVNGQTCTLGSSCTVNAVPTSTTLIGPGNVALTNATRLNLNIYNLAAAANYTGTPADFVNGFGGSVYTVPSSRKTWIYTVSMTKQNGTPDCVAFTKLSGTYTILGGTPGGTPGNMGLNVILTAGQGLGFICTGVASTITSEAVEFDATVPLVTYAATMGTNGTNTLISTSAITTGQFFQPVTYTTGLLGQTNSAVLNCINTGSTVNFTPYTIPSGQSQGATFAWSAATAIATNAGGWGQAPTMAAGDSMTIVTNAASSTAMACYITGLQF
jgi:hypothetical protein